MAEMDPKEVLELLVINKSKEYQENLKKNKDDSEEKKRKKLEAERKKLPEFHKKDLWCAIEKIKNHNFMNGPCEFSICDNERILYLTDFPEIIEDRYRYVIEQLNFIGFIAKDNGKKIEFDYLCLFKRISVRV